MQLNKQQYKAAQPTMGINVVLAGAGTGKTKTLLSKIKNIMLHTNLTAKNILILTFSKKAAIELQERITLQYGNEAKQITATTFHAFCLKTLQEYSVVFQKTFGFTTFPTILQDGDANNKIRAIVTSRLHKFMGIPLKAIMKLLTSPNIHPAVQKKLESLGLHKELKLLKQLFAKYKQKNNLIDYNDLMQFTITLLQQNPQISKKLHTAYKYIFVDEFQDTSNNNFVLLKLLLPDAHPNLFAVGDDRQSIYAFRLANINYILKPQKYFRNIQKHSLKINYRSKQEIVKLSNSFIRKNRQQTRKKIKSHCGKGGTIKINTVTDFKDEVDSISKILQNEIQKQQSIAILYRNNWQGHYLKQHTLLLQQTPGINMMTMHASKGLEFDCVIIAGICDNIIPDRDSVITEERRLLYVAITRAMQKLFIIVHKNEKDNIALFGRELGIKE